MKKVFCFSTLFLFSIIVNAQGIFNVIASKEYSKDVAVFQAKEFLMNNILQVSDQPLQFEVDALAAANSLELISLWYKCESQKQEGLILGFYGDYVNENGLLITGYSFKNLPKDKAVEFITKIETTLSDQAKWLAGNDNVKNVCFKYDDMELLIYIPEEQIGEKYLRVFWGPFDATWNNIAFNRTKKRLLKKMQ
jgi:hypothetical protein